MKQRWYLWNGGKDLKTESEKEKELAGLSKKQGGGGEGYRGVILSVFWPNLFWIFELENTLVQYAYFISKETQARSDL